jgi:hypothetical protein
MFLIKNSTRVIWGPKVWDKSEIQNFIYRKYSIDFPVPWSNPNNKIYEIQEDVFLMPVIEKEKPEKHPRSQSWVGPMYEYDAEFAYEYYEVEDNTIEIVRNQSLSWIAQSRKYRENYGTKVSLGGIEYWIPTAREKRATIFNGGAGTWKLHNPIYSNEDKLWGKGQAVWVDLTDQDISDMTQAIKDHVNETFAQEKILMDYFNSLQTVDEIVAIDLTNEAMENILNTL